MIIDTFVNSGYFDKMSDSDKIARHLHPQMDKEQIIAHYAKRIVPFTETEQRLIQKIDADLKAILNTKWKRAALIKWSYVKTIDLENNFPHTHGNIICIPHTIMGFEYNKLLKVIVHEFVHVFQRMEPIITNRFIEEFGYKPHGQRESYDYNIRLNPDTNNIIYRNKEGRVELMVYSTESPSSLLDTHNILIYGGDVFKTVSNSKTEHPFEYMAYFLTDMLVDDSGKNK